MWKGTAGRLAFAPQDGIEVIVTGKLTTYPGRSKYQIVIERMELAGEGALMQLLDKLRQKLAGEGLFDPARKQPLPFLPRVIGVVTSPTGAVIRDILHRLADRCPTHVLLWPVLVQGDGAAAQIAAAVRGFDAMAAEGAIPRPDLIIVARGGGSIEDLWAFNEEAVVRAVADCSIPIISAVGHETDTTLCDFAADVRAPTPTAAAEIAVPVRADLIASLTELGLRAGRAVRRGTEQARERLGVQMRLLPAPDALLAAHRQRSDDLGERLGRGLRHRVSLAWRQLSDVAGALRPAVLHQRVERDRGRLAALRLRPELLTRALADRRTALDGLWRLALSLDPRRPLALGFAMVTGADGRVLTRAADARAAGHMRLTFQDGALDVTAREDRVQDGAGLAAAPVRAISSVSKPARKGRSATPETGQNDLFSQSDDNGMT